MGLVSAFTCCFPSSSKSPDAFQDSDSYPPPAFDEKSPLLISDRGYVSNETCYYPPPPIQYSYHDNDDDSYHESRTPRFIPDPFFHDVHIDDDQSITSSEQDDYSSDDDDATSFTSNPRQTDGQKADDIISIIVHSDELPFSNALRSDLRTAISTSGVSTDGLGEWLAEKILDRLRLVIDKALRDEKYKRSWGRALAQAVEEAERVKKDVFRDLVDFVERHPHECEAALGVLLTIVALGVLVQVAPFMIEMLGFAELGPVEGSFAAYWESTYGGSIPAGSMFSFFQRLGMTWRRM